MVEKKSPVATVKTEEKKASVETVKVAAGTNTAEAAKTATKSAAKEEVKEPAKAEKKPAAKKTAAKKTAEKKPVVRKTAAKAAAEPVSSVILQYGGKEIVTADLTEKVKAIWTAEGKKAADLRDIKLYVKPEEYTVYYVINGDITGSFDL